MPTVTTVTVKPSGGDYTSLSSAEAGEQADLVSADVQLDIECYSMLDTTAVSFNGWTTDSTRYVRVFTPTAERHSGKYDSAKYRLEAGGFGVGCLDVYEDYTIIDGLQLKANTAGNVAGHAFWSSGGVVKNNIFYAHGGNYAHVHLQGGGSLGTAVSFFNNVVYGATVSKTVSVSTFTSHYVKVYNNTAASGYSLGADNATAGEATNNIFESYDLRSVTSTTNASYDASTGTSGLRSIAHSTSTFVNVTGGSEDYHLVSGSALIDVGTDLSGTFTTDIDGVTRTVTWDIGADEYVSAATVISYLTLLGVG